MIASADLHETLKNEVQERLSQLLPGAPITQPETNSLPNGSIVKWPEESGRVAAFQKANGHWKLLLPNGKLKDKAWGGLGWACVPAQPGGVDRYFDWELVRYGFGPSS